MEHDHNTSFAAIALLLIVGSFILSPIVGVAGIVVCCLVVYVLLSGVNAIDSGEKKARAAARNKYENS